MSSAPGQSARVKWTAPAAACGLAIVASAIIYFAAGDSLGLFFGGVVSVALFLPYLVNRGADRDGASGRPAACAIATVAGTAIVWVFPVFHSSITFFQWL